MSVSVQPIIAGHDLAFVGNLRGHTQARIIISTISKQAEKFIQMFRLKRRLNR